MFHRGFLQEKHTEARRTNCLFPAGSLRLLEGQLWAHRQFQGSPCPAQALQQTTGPVLGSGVCARLSCFPYLAHWSTRPQSRAWAVTDGDLLDYSWNKFPAALEWSVLAGELLRKSSGTPSFHWNKPEAGLAGGLIMLAQPVLVFASQKKASGGTESPEQSSRWTQTWPDFLICCRSGKVKGKEKAQWAGDT